SVEIMRRAGGDTKAIAIARDVIDRQSQQLSRIVEDLIDVTRIVEKKIELRKEIITLGSVVQMAVETCRSQMESRRHRLTVTLPPEPFYLEVDSARISQVFINLLDNAAKYTEPGGEIWLTAEKDTVESSTRNHSQPGDVIVRVRDAGMGIDADLLPYVFDMF